MGEWHLVQLYQGQKRETFTWRSRCNSNVYLLFELSINTIHQRSGEEGHVKLVIYILL